MLLIDNETVQSVLSMDATINALEQAYTKHVKGEAVCRPRIDIKIPTPDPNKHYRWGTMEGGSSSGYFAIRIKSDIIYRQNYQGASTEEKYCVKPGTYCGLILLTSTHNGEPLAIINDGVLQHMRVGADGGLGVKYVAREDAEIVGMLGSGGQARSHMAAYMYVRPGIKRLQVFSPTRDNCERFAEEIRTRYKIDVEVCETPASVYKNADILAAVTDSAIPVIDADRIEPGTHVINIGGGGSPGNNVLKRVDIYLRFGNATAPRGFPDFDIADEHLTYEANSANADGKKQEKTGKRGHGSLLPERMITFADIINNGLSSARTSANHISYSERGNIQGHQFWSVAGHVYESARKQGLGRELPTEWFLQNIRN